MASECGFEIDEEGSSVIDHLNYDVNDDGKVSTVGVNNEPEALSAHARWLFTLSKIQSKAAMWSRTQSTCGKVQFCSCFTKNQPRL